MAVCEIPWIIYGLFILTLHSNIVQQAVLLLSDVWKKMKMFLWPCDFFCRGRRWGVEANYAYLIPT